MGKGAPTEDQGALTQKKVMTLHIMRRMNIEYYLVPDFPRLKVGVAL